MVGDGTIAATRIVDCCVLNVPEDLGGQRIEQLQAAVLGLGVTRDLRAVVFDCSALQYADIHEFRSVKKVFDALGVLGVEAILAGLNPGIVIHLVEHGFQLGPTRSFLSLGDALEALGLTRREATG